MAAMAPTRRPIRLWPLFSAFGFHAPKAGPPVGKPFGKAPLWTLLIALVVACGTATFVVQQYHGDPLPSERVAILRINGGDEARIAALDGEPLNYALRDTNTRVHVEMLPGQHEIAVSEPITGLTRSRQFRAEPGKVYRVRIVRHRLQRAAGVPHTWSLAIDEVDRRTDEPRAEVPEPPLPVVRAAQPATSAAPAPPLPTPAPIPSPSPDAGVGGAPGLPEPDPLPQREPLLPSVPTNTGPQLPPSPRPLPLEPPPAVPLQGAGGSAPTPTRPSGEPANTPAAPSPVP